MKIIVPTCDAYADTVRVNLHYLNKVWPEHPRVVVVANSKPENIADADIFRLPTDEQFGSNMLTFLEQYEDPSLLIWLDDYFIKGIDRDVVEKAIRLVNENVVDCVRLSKMYTPEGEPYAEDSRFCLIDKQAPYNLSLQASVWNTDIFRRLLRRGETAWETEIFGSGRTEISQRPFLGVTVPALEYDNAYYQGTVDKGTFKRLLNDF